MQIGIQVVENHYQDYLDAAQWAEQRGLAAFAVPDHYLYRRGDDESKAAHDALALMAALAAQTTTIELVVLVSPVTFRHPAVLAKNYATIQEIANGRFLLGVGTGWMEAEHERFGFDFPALGERYAMLEENLEYLTAAYRAPMSDFEGERYSLQAFDMSPHPALRLLVGGTGAEKTPRLAGTYAEEFNAYELPGQDYRAKLDVAKQAAVAVGRDPAALRISTSGLLIGGATPDEAGEEAVRVAQMVGRDADEMLESLQARRTTFGTWDEIRAALQSLESDGVTRFYVQNLDPFDPSEFDRKLTAIGF